MRQAAASSKSEPHMLSRLVIARRFFGVVILLVSLGVGIAFNASDAQTAPRDADGIPGKSLDIASVSVEDQLSYGAAVRSHCACTGDQYENARSRGVHRACSLEWQHSLP